jgi:hypothetical protein
MVVKGRCCTVAVMKLAEARLYKPIATVEFPFSGNRRKGTPVLRRILQMPERPIPIVEYVLSRNVLNNGFKAPLLFLMSFQMGRNSSFHRFGLGLGGPSSLSL